MPTRSAKTRANTALYATDFKKKLIMNLPQNAEFIQPEKHVTTLVEEWPQEI